jgi:MarR family transcriptional regulator, organic hydroperoxide resistance regulator
VKYDHLKLSNQVCFPLYAASRLVTREYQPFLDELGITYPQYLVMLVLWEKDCQSVNEITSKLLLNTNTVTPLLKRMEKLKLVSRTRSEDDERKVQICLTNKGNELKLQASEIPFKLSENLTSGDLSVDELIKLKDQLYKVINYLEGK